MKMLDLYSRNHNQPSLWNYKRLKPTLLPVHNWSNKLNPNLIPHVPDISSEQLYTAYVVLPSSFFSLLKIDNQSVLFK